jgi:hypothetical protein
MEPVKEELRPVKVVQTVMFPMAHQTTVLLVALGSQAMSIIPFVLLVQGRLIHQSQAPAKLVQFPQ